MQALHPQPQHQQPQHHEQQPHQQLAQHQEHQHPQEPAQHQSHIHQLQQLQEYQQQQQHQQFMMPTLSPSYPHPAPVYGGGLGTSFPELLPFAPVPYPNPTISLSGTSMGGSIGGSAGSGGVHGGVVGSDLGAIPGAMGGHMGESSISGHMGSGTAGGSGAGNTSANAAAAESWVPRHDEPRAQIGPSEYAQALEIAHHIRAALPHMRSADAPGPPANGQPFRSLYDIASTAVNVLSGIAPKTIPTVPLGTGSAKARPSAQGMPEAKRTRITNGVDGKDKTSTYCRGCGATETPEWRRGPLGPRTLCNACGLVHMKMMRKKKKEEEKAAAEAALRTR